MWYDDIPALAAGAVVLGLIGWALWPRNTLLESLKDARSGAPEGGTALHRDERGRFAKKA